MATADEGGMGSGGEVSLSSLSREQLVELLREDLVELAEGKLDPGEIEAEGHLFDYGYIDSLTGVSFLARIEERFRVVIEDIELLDDLTSLDAIAKRLLEAR